MVTYTTLRHAFLELQKNTGALPKASRSKLNADTPDLWNYFNYKNDGGKSASSWAATGRKMFTSPSVADL